MATIAQRLSGLGPTLAGLAVLAMVALLQFADLAPLERVRMQVFDGYQRANPRDVVEDSRVAIIDIDEPSIEALGQWPWPRTEMATLTRRLAEAGAAVVVYDIVFSEADRTSPEQLAERFGESADIREILEELPAHDGILAESFASVPVVVGFFLDSGDRGREVEPKAPFTIHGTLPDRHVPVFKGAIQSLPPLVDAAQGAGFVTRGGDADEIVRRVPLVAIHNGKLVPSLSLEAVRVATDAGNPNLMASDAGRQNRNQPGAAVSIRLGDNEIPLNDAGEIWIHFPPPDTSRHLSAIQVLSGAMSDTALAEAVSGRIVFVGGSAVGLNDQVSTPLSERIGGVTVQAAAVEQMLEGHYLQRPDWALGLEMVATLILGGLLAFLLPRLGALPGLLVAAFGITIAVAASWLAFTRMSYLLDPTYPVLAIALVYIFQTAVVFFREERKRRYIHSAFDRYLSPAMVKQIAASPEKLELGGEEREMSVLMCDIRGFSSISERYAPNDVITFLIDFLTPMSDILLDHKATIDKYIGDAILAFWNAPLDDPDHHRNAACAALEMITVTQRLNRDMPRREGAVWPGEVKIGIGLNSGLCCVGNMGSRQRLNYSLIGDTVNLAARLEGQTKHYGVPIIAGAAMAASLPDFALLEIDRIRVVGREAPETIHALLGDAVVQQSEEFQKLAGVHAQVITAYRQQQWQKAAAALTKAHRLYADWSLGQLHDLFTQRLERLQRDPPGSGWDGVYQAEQK